MRRTEDAVGRERGAPRAHRCGGRECTTSSVREPMRTMPEGPRAPPPAVVARSGVHSDPMDSRVESTPIRLITTSGFHSGSGARFHPAATGPPTGPVESTVPHSLLAASVRTGGAPRVRPAAEVLPCAGAARDGRRLRRRVQRYAQPGRVSELLQALRAAPARRMVDRNHAGLRSRVWPCTHSLGRHLQDVRGGRVPAGAPATSPCVPRGGARRSGVAACARTPHGRLRGASGCGGGQLCIVARRPLPLAHSP